MNSPFPPQPPKPPMKPSADLRLVVRAATLLLGACLVSDVLADGTPPPAETADTSPDELLVEEEPNPLYQLFGEVDDLLTGGDTNAATAKILGAWDDVRYAKYRTDLATITQRFLLFTDQAPKAREAFLETIRTEPEAARPGFDILYSYYLGTGDADAATAWAHELLDQPLPPDMRQAAAGWYLDGLLQTAGEEAFFQALPMLDDFEPGQACAIAADLCRAAYNRGKFELLAKELATFRAAPYGSSEDLSKTAALYDLLVRGAQGDWTGVSDTIDDAISLLPVRDLRFALTRLFEAARKQGRPAEAESLAERVLRSETCRAYPGVLAVASREWIALGLAADVATFPQRIAALRDFGVPADTILSNVNRHFYDVLNDREVVVALVKELDALAPLLDEDSRRNTLDSLLLDASFVTEDYARVLAILERGIPDRDEDWHEMTKTKMRAHLAMQNGDTDEAVRQFRAFMDLVAKTTEVQLDPSTGIMHSPESILAFNARRIGDIYAKAGRADEAAAAYAEARERYAKALAIARGEVEGTNPLGPETEKYLEEEIEKLP